MKTKAFTLIELLVVTATILVLVTLTAAAVSGARSSQRKNQTRVTISKINDILMSQWRTYPSQSGSPAYVRRSRITADLPPNWKDVSYLVNHTDYKNPNPSSVEFPEDTLTRAQKTYISRYRNGPTPTPEFGDDECLFLAIMYGGFAGCLDCAGLRAGKDFRDTDNDGWNEFVDAWGNPLSFILWPAGLQDPTGNNFFNVGSSNDSLTFGMRPLVFSAGPNGLYGIEMGGTAGSPGIENLMLGVDCGNPKPTSTSPYTTIGSQSSSSDAADNITNFDAEFRR
jgi:type II secretory pathway pseudopilin PulG